MTIAVLALQGAFIEHEKCLDMLNIKHYEIRQASDLRREHDGIIIPGGESTTISKLLKETKLFDPMVKEINAGMPVFGTCAGLILLAKEVEGDAPEGLKTMDITVKRNAYGRQLGSFATHEKFAEEGMIPMTFIRAPFIEKVGENVQIAAVVDRKIVAARENNQLVTAFHPELTNDLTVHKFFAGMVNTHRHACD